MSEFWETQEGFESEAGWNTKDRIRAAEDPKATRIEELEFSLHRAYEESIEMVQEISDISIDQKDGDSISDEKYDKLGYEAVDTLIFLKKAGDTLEGGINEYLREERIERYDEEGGEALEELLEPVRNPELDNEKQRTRGLVARTEDIYGELGPNPESSDFDFIIESEVDEVLQENLYKQVADIKENGEYKNENELGRKLASTMLDVVELMEYLPRENSRYFEEKQEENEERLGSGEDFGVGDHGYGRTPEWLITDDISQAPESSYIEMVSKSVSA
ncbi:hypothetical protein GLU64_01670 [Nanohaloarchaea archaeon]|nr:hypothetical protein [Candidatus Nanohaloarchaea archaeon]